MSVYSFASNLTSILKKYSSDGREKAKSAIINKVTFDLVSLNDINKIIYNFKNNINYVQYNELVFYLKQNDGIKDNDLLKAIRGIKGSINLLSIEFVDLIEAIISINWFTKNDEIVREYKDFILTLLIAHNKYIPIIIANLISYWSPNENDAINWINNMEPNELKLKELQIVHELLEKILNVIPMAYDTILDRINSKFPYYKKKPFITGSYIHNMFWFLKYRPLSTEDIFTILIKKLINLDANAPRNEIEDAEDELDCGDVDNEIENQTINNKTETCIVVETLDVCMEKLLNYTKEAILSGNKVEVKKFFKIILKIFDNFILHSHNIHHVQFLIFYICSVKPIFTVSFLKLLWEKITNPNISVSIRQTAIYYIASFLARAKFLSLDVIRKYLFDMCSWAHLYIQQNDSVRRNNSLKTNLIFYSICQTIFYVIAFRSKELTADKKDLLFLQSLQLSALVTCSLNPLKVCAPAIATTFAGVTRSYQLAYCHAILERNARRKLATVYGNVVSMPDEYLETYFPFDPYLLQKSGKYIEPIYLKYQGTDEIEDDDKTSKMDVNELRRKHCDSEVSGDDIDDFITEKRQRLLSTSSNDKELF